MKVIKIELLVIGIMILIGSGVLYLVKAGNNVTILPQIEVADITMGALSDEKIHLNANFNVSNSLPIGIHFDSIEYQAFLEGENIVSNTYADSLTIDAHDTSRITLPITLFLDTIQSVVGRLKKEEKDSIHVKIKAKVFITNTILKEKWFPFKIAYTVPRLKSPRIEIQNVNWQKFGLNHTKILIEIKGYNPNAFSFGIDSAKYRLTLSGNEIAVAEKENKIIFPSKKDTVFNLPLDIDASDIGKTGLDYIKKGDNLYVRFKLLGVLLSGSKVLDKSKLDLTIKGDLKDFTEDKK